METSPTWLRPVIDAMNGLPEGQCLVVDVPVYRPDLARQMAAELDLAFHDFREEYLKQQGKEAERAPIEALDTWLTACVGDEPTLLHNAEALLACHGSEQRAAWFAALARRNWPNRLVVPLYLFGGELDEHASTRVALDYETLPEQGLVSRLLNA